MKIRIFTDGACSGNGTINSKAGIGVVVEWQNKKPTIISEYLGEGLTNNIAEYRGVIKALDFIYHNQISNVEINSDSKLIVNQINGNWRCKDSKLKPLLIKSQKKLNYLRNKLNYNIDIIYIPRKFNLADEPAKNSLK